MFKSNFRVLLSLLLQVAALFFLGLIALAVSVPYYGGYYGGVGYPVAYRSYVAAPVVSHSYGYRTYGAYPYASVYGAYPYGGYLGGYGAYGYLKK